MTHKGVVFLRGGSATWHQDEEENPRSLEALRVVSMAHTMKLRVRAMLKVPRA